MALTLPRDLACTEIVPVGPGFVESARQVMGLQAKAPGQTGREFMESAIKLMDGGFTEVIREEALRCILTEIFMSRVLTEGVSVRMAEHLFQDLLMIVVG